ncbi:ATP-dependent DNA helicase RecG [bacterium]|nr:ATP-dependent DNA helicase RecG [bacterium]
MENLEQIKKAIEVEIKHRYIDIRGKKLTFSGFIKNEAKKLYKSTGKNPRWEVIAENFARYKCYNIIERKRAIEHLIKAIKLSIDEENQTNQIVQCSQKNKLQSPDKVDVTYIKGVGPRVAYLLNKLGIYTALDLITYFPKKHIDYSKRTLIKNLTEGETTTVFGYIKSVSAFNTKNNLSILKVKIQDESGNLELQFFSAKSNRMMQERMKAQFPVNSAIMVSGKVKRDNYSGKLTFDKPTYSIMSGEFEEEKDKNLNLGRIVPIYTVCEGLNIKTLRRAISNAIEIYKDYITDVIPDFLIKKHGLLSKKISVEQIHFPKSMELLEQARFSLIFEELFLIQLRLAKLRDENEHNNHCPVLKTKSDGLVQKFIKNLPFELTRAQKNSINVILNDLMSEKPMARLLQGDVGSGKTVVATIMLLAGVENGYQGAFMAPTEILAQQHYNNLVNWLAPLGLRIGLFLGSQTKKSRTKLETDLRNGQIDIAVGTHALIQDNIEFANLGAIVVDEQHRFGVKQRNFLKKKSQNPQILTMTATPIPRTLALTVHGDLDLTIIDELPKGRKPVKTALVSSHKLIYKQIREEIEKGRQAYIVYPLIEESETLSAKAATIEAEKLQNEVFPDLRIGLLHGKLKNSEKEKVMSDFKKGKYDILVCTTVVEVGVDVPNATFMLIENAERFGLSQLHQLRGRVGRSEHQSYCVLFSNTTNTETRERLKIMTETNDGFVIAEKDLQLRGPGEFLGTRQSGLPDLIISDIVRDAKILELARKEAIDFVHTQNFDDYPLLKDISGFSIYGDFLTG